MTHAERLYCSAHCNDDIWYHPETIQLALQALQNQEHERSDDEMGYRAKKNYDDLENLNEATESYFAQQRAALGKTFVFAYIWDVFGKYIAVGGAILMFLLGMLTGWLIRGPGNGGAPSAEAPPSLSADAAVNDSDEEEEQTSSTEDETTETTEETNATTKASTTKRSTKTTTTTSDTDETETDETTTGTDPETEQTTTTAQTTEQTSVTGGTTTKATNTTTKTTAKTTTKTTTRTTAKTTTTTAKTTTTTVTTTTTTTTTTAPKKHNIGTIVKRNVSTQHGDEYHCAFTVTLTNNMAVSLSSQNVKFSVPSSCTGLTGRIVGGDVTLSGTTLSITSQTALAPGASTTITFTLVSTTNLTADNLVRQ